MSCTLMMSSSSRPTEEAGVLKQSGFTEGFINSLRDDEGVIEKAFITS